MPKTSILVIFGQKGPFWTVFGQNGQNGENYQKSAWNIFSHLQALTNCKISEKSNERFPRKIVAYERTYGRTNGQTRLLRSQRPVGRETKTPHLTEMSFLFILGEKFTFFPYEPHYESLLPTLRKILKFLKWRFFAFFLEKDQKKYFLFLWFLYS